MSQVSSIGLLGRVCEGFDLLGSCASKPSYAFASIVQLFRDRQSCLAGINNRSLGDQERRLRAIPLVLQVGASATLIVAGAVSTCYAVKNFFSKSKNGTITHFNTLYRGAQVSQAAFHLLDLTVNHDLYSPHDCLTGAARLLCMSVYVIATHIIQNESTHLSAYNASNGLAKRPKVPGIAYFGLRRVSPLESRLYRMSATWVQATFNVCWWVALGDLPRRYATYRITERNQALQKFLQVKRQIGPYQCAIATCDLGFLPPEAAAQGKLYDFPHQKRLLAHVKGWTENNWIGISWGYLSFDRFMQSRPTQQLVTLANREAVYVLKIEKALSSHKRLQPLCGAISQDLPLCAVLDSTTHQHLYEREFIQEWLKKSSTSPMTRRTMTQKDLISLPNTNVLIRGVRDYLWQHCESGTPLEELVDRYLNTHSSVYDAAIGELKGLGVNFYD